MAEIASQAIELALWHIVHPHWFYLGDWEQVVSLFVGVGQRTSNNRALEDNIFVDVGILLLPDFFHLSLTHRIDFMPQAQAIAQCYLCASPLAYPL